MNRAMAAIQEQAAERDDERLQSEAGDQHAVECPEQGAEHEDRQHGDRPRDVPLGQHDRKQHPEQGERRADGQIDAAGDDHQAESQAEDPERPIRRAVFWRFAADTKRGLSTVTMAHNTTSSANVASSFFTSRRFYRCLGLGVLAPCGARCFAGSARRFVSGSLSLRSLDFYQFLRRGPPGFSQARTARRSLSLLRKKGLGSEHCRRQLKFRQAV
jgi:hypothetical protein